MAYTSLFWKVWINPEGFWDKIPVSTSAVKSKSIAMKYSIHVTCRTGEKASYAWSHKDSSDSNII